uniref:Uncharacterized protein n=1 Tax=Oryza sativa subsp. japonica TaxID=39947 RepID=Q2R4T6_ORYSJ|nr:hypothetical protein LOC_Os11g27360 [Oryza sativa Japonica Group]
MTLEDRELLDCIMENTSFVCCETVLEIEDTHEEPPMAKSENTTSTSHDSTVESSPEPREPKVEIQPSEFPFQFEGDLFEDYGSPSNYSCQKSAPVLRSSPMPLKEILFKEMQQELTTIMRDEWLREVELSSEVIRINTPSLTITCLMREAMVQTLYNPTIGANIMSTIFALNCLGDEPLAPIEKTLSDPIWSYHRRLWDSL